MKFKERVELIKGKIYKMSPAPSSLHQRISMILSAELYGFLKKKSCKVFHAPFDVRLAKHFSEENIISVIQPDICVICDRNKIDKNGCLGTPDIIIEILSPSNNEIELKLKYDLYESNKVKEYWIVYPYEQSIQIFKLNDESKFIGLKPLFINDVLITEILPGFQLNLNEVFDDLMIE